MNPASPPLHAPLPPPPSPLQVWGWVQEMYAFAMAMYSAGLHDIDLIPHLIAQVWGITVCGGASGTEGDTGGGEGWAQDRQAGMAPHDGVHLIPPST